MSNTNERTKLINKSNMSLMTTRPETKHASLILVDLF